METVFIAAACSGFFTSKFDG